MSSALPPAAPVRSTSYATMLYIINASSNICQQLSAMSRGTNWSAGFVLGVANTQDSHPYGRVREI